MIKAICTSETSVLTNSHMVSSCLRRHILHSWNGFLQVLNSLNSEPFPNKVFKLLRRCWRRKSVPHSIPQNWRESFSAVQIWWLRWWENWSWNSCSSNHDRTVPEVWMWELCFGKTASLFGNKAWTTGCIRLPNPPVYILPWNPAAIWKWRPMRLWDVKDPTLFRTSAHRWRWVCQPYASTAALPHRNIIFLLLVFIPLRGGVNQRA
jgi:hypothetical protein